MHSSNILIHIWFLSWLFTFSYDITDCVHDACRDGCFDIISLDLSIKVQKQNSIQHYSVLTNAVLFHFIAHLIGLNQLANVRNIICSLGLIGSHVVCFISAQSCSVEGQTCLKGFAWNLRAADFIFWSWIRFCFLVFEAVSCKWL